MCFLYKSKELLPFDFICGNIALFHLAENFHRFIRPNGKLSFLTSYHYVSGMECFTLSLSCASLSAQKFLSDRYSFSLSGLLLPPSLM